MAAQLPDEGVSFKEMEDARLANDMPLPTAWDYQDAGVRDHDNGVLPAIMNEHERARLK